MNADLAETLEVLHPVAFGWALHCCKGDHGRAEEVLQNAYLKVVQGGAYSGRSSIKTWWFGMIRLTAMEEYRRARSRESLLGRVWRWASGESPDTARSVSVRMEQHEQRDVLEQSLNELSPRQAEVLHLVFYQDMTLVEAADAMGIGVGSARQHYERGKTRLRELLASELCDAN